MTFKFRSSALLAVFAAFAGTQLVSHQAQAYFSTIDTGELIAPDKYQVSLEPQLIFNRYEGFDIVGRVDTGLTEATGLRGILGFGKVNFQIGGMYKWVPFPDVAGQPAIGLDAGVILARIDENTEFNVRLHPLISKRLESEIGDFVPYASLPLGVSVRKEKTVVPLQIAGGTEFRPLNLPRISFFAELGININEAFSYVSLAAAYRFDDSSISRR